MKSSGITQYSDIKGKKIAAGTGATGDLVATEQFPGNDISRVDQVSTAIQAVVSGQADVVFDDYSTLSLASADNPNLMTLTPLTVEPSGIMVPLNDHQWVNWLNWFLADYYVRGLDLRVRFRLVREVVQGHTSAADLPLLVRSASTRPGLVGSCRST